MTTLLWHFTAMDSLFFRDGSPMNVGESAWVDSQFPPSGQTLQGALRAAILDYLDADIRKFQNGEACLPDNGGSLKDEIGDARSIGSLRLTGPFIGQKKNLFFPAPLDLVRNKERTYGLLRPSRDAVSSDIGTLRFPCISGQGYKTMADRYISLTSLDTILRNRVDVIETVPLIANSPEGKGFADREPKIGLARNNGNRQHRDGMLFAIAPVRPRNDVELVLETEGITQKHVPDEEFLQKLGGEGKLAHVSVGGSLDLPGPYIHRDAKGEVLRFKIVCLSPLLPESGQLLPEVHAMQNQEQAGVLETLWQGKIGACCLKVISACIGKPHRIGGWDIKNWRPRPLRAFIPAGSVFFCEAMPNQEAAVQALHNTKIGKETEYGFGHILIGEWSYTGAQS